MIKSVYKTSIYNSFKLELTFLTCMKYIFLDIERVMTFIKSIFILSEGIVYRNVGIKLFFLFQENARNCRIV